MSAHSSADGAVAGIPLGWTLSDDEVKEREVRPISTVLSERTELGRCPRGTHTWPLLGSGLRSGLGRRGGVGRCSQVTSAWSHNEKEEKPHVPQGRSADGGLPFLKMTGFLGFPGASSVPHWWQRSWKLDGGTRL